ncbi:LptA/OstA family protein [Aquamicrobium zhengzhouense]|uniref:LPS ABC transporter substrate-binding protein LptA n=1 Tax=Aquamicrobium zhengzhouense TaxID=2781738 RepID=A0ABS0SEY8_9HYPH|nr:LptA/OstA family protein [Aquamicrobium zhengzhouense]MBI1621860.1 LPS ABC transporter substrate-binding protein LptA [Aquamicrobium zhengzhouense]
MRIDTRAVMLAAALTLPFGGLASAQEGRLTGIKLDGGKPIQIESDRLEVREADGLALFTGNVSVVQGPTLLRAGQMTVYYNTGDDGSATTGSADIDRLEVSGKVYVRSESQVATGDAGSFDMRTEVLVLTGKEVVLTEGENVVVGCKLTVQMATGQAQLDGCGGNQAGGRVKMLLKPSSQGR